MADREVSFENGDVVIRKARPSDFQAVMDIDDNVYDGYDYMPSMFQQFLQSRHYFTLVLEYCGKLVGLVNYYLDDSEPHIVTGLSSRIVKEHRGRGFYRLFDITLRRTFPQLTHALGVMVPKFGTPDMTKFYQWTSLFYQLPVELLIRRLTDSLFVQDNSPARPLTYNMVDDLLRTDCLEHFFGRYSINYIPGQWHYRPIKIDKRGLKELFATSSWALLTDCNQSGNSVTDQASSFPKTSNDTSKIAAVSYSFFFQAKVGLACEVFFYGDDLMAAISHVIGHARHLVTVAKANVGFVFHFPEGLDAEKISDCLHDILGTRYKMESFVMGTRPVYRTESKL